MWSKRLMKQRAVCHLCRNNYMEMVFTGHCVALEQPVLNWQQRRKLAAVGADCPEWFAFWSKPGVSAASLCLIAASLASVPAECGVSYASPDRNLNREMSFSDRACYVASTFIKLGLSEALHRPKQSSDYVLIQPSKCNALFTVALKETNVLRLHCKHNLTEVSFREKISQSPIFTRAG